MREKKRRSAHAALGPRASSGIVEGVLWPTPRAPYNGPWNILDARLYFLLCSIYVLSFLLHLHMIHISLSVRHSLFGLSGLQPDCPAPFYESAATSRETGKGSEAQRSSTTECHLICTFKSVFVQATMRLHVGAMCFADESLLTLITGTVSFKR